ncbi:tetratricopeptide repeat protein [Candidatus Entotheonella palauensis]|uniref:tetratricopeptide repeat protein n=1 Tax=Candidatus Entotheonella palauensis TaxID=93172 RepID=UPI000B7DE45D|nr:tetratricopeptide repeat protein [Candidatus Entotheonella palauensis]
MALGELRTYQAWRALVAKDISDDVKAQEIATLQQAAELYEQSLRQTPTEVHAQLGWLRNRMIHQLFGILPPSEDEDDLLSRCEQVATLAPTYPHIQYGLGDILLYSQDKMAELHVALPFFRRAVQLHQRYDEPVWNAYRRILPEAKALQNFARTMPNTAQGHLKIAQIIEDTHWPQARLHYRAAMSLSRSDPTILSAYADALMHHEDFVLARQLWSRYLDLVPEQADAYLKLASASKALKDDAGTVQALEQLVARFPDQARYESELAQAYLRMGKTEAAAEAWQRVVALKPRSPLAYVNLARIYEQHGERDQAFEMYLQLTRLRPKDANLMYKVGEYYRQAGDLSKALRYYRRAVKLKPTHAKFRQTLEQTLKLSKP